MLYDTHDLRHLRRIIGQNIRHHRTRQTLTLARLARRSGVGERLLDYYELGRDAIDLNALFRISRVLGVRVEEMMGEGTITSSPPPPAKAP